MPWHKVVIIHDDKARWSAAALMRPFIMGYHEHGAPHQRMLSCIMASMILGIMSIIFLPKLLRLLLRQKLFRHSMSPSVLSNLIWMDVRKSPSASRSSVAERYNHFTQAVLI